MKDLQKIAKECIEELNAIGIKQGKILRFEINTRAKKRWGQCRMTPNGFTINISYRLLGDSVDIMALKNTIMHEILHTCNGCLNHGAEWKRYADKVNRAYGYNIKRCTSAEEKGLERVQTTKIIKHKFVCECCGQVITRQKESNFTKHYNLYKCGRCGGDFKKLF